MIARLLNEDGRGSFVGTAALFACVLAFGGLGPHAPLANGFLQAAAFPLLVSIAVFERSRLPRQASGAILLALLCLLVGVCQLVPLPAGVWSTLPGRDVPGMILDTLGWKTQSRALSLSPDDTRQTIESWLPPIAILLGALTASTEERRRLATLAVTLALASSVLALLQFSFGDGSLFLYPTPPFDRFPGLFANFNHQAAFLACAVALLPAMWTPSRRSSITWSIIAWPILLFGVLVTSSRAGLVLFGVATIASAVRLFGSPPSSDPSRRDVLTRRNGLIAVGGIVAASVVALVAQYRLDLMSSRFEAASGDLRFGFWANTLTTIRMYFPYGAGFGTFEAAYQVGEPIESIQTFLVNHAHNDYLEIVVDAGIAGVVLVALFVLWFTSRIISLKIGRLRPVWHDTALSGVLTVVLLMLHSVVDYPLRTEALGCVFALACGLLVPPDPSDTKRKSRDSR